MAINFYLFRIAQMDIIVTVKLLASQVCLLIRNAQLVNIVMGDLKN